MAVEEFTAKSISTPCYAHSLPPGTRVVQLEVTTSYQDMLSAHPTLYLQVRAHWTMSHRTESCPSQRDSWRCDIQSWHAAELNHRFLTKKGLADIPFVPAKVHRRRRRNMKHSQGGARAVPTSDACSQVRRRPGREERRMMM